MADDSTIWHFYLENSQTRKDGLSTLEARSYVATLQSQDVQSCLVWYDGLIDWRPLEDFPELFSSGKSTLRPLATPPPLPEKRADAAILDLALEETPSNYQDRRANERFAKSFKVIYRFRDQDFESMTINISLGGMLLRTPLPDGLQERFAVRLSRKDGRFLDLFCMPIIDSNSNRCLRVKFVDNEREAMLRNWLFDNIDF